MNTENFVAGIVGGIIFSFLGCVLIFWRARVIDAMIASNQVFWEKIGYSPNNKRGRFLANVMIPFIGIVFLAAGVYQLYDSVTYLLK